MRHIISVLMENEPGALSRVVGLFSQRNYNIDSLTVAPTEDTSLSRLTLTTTGDDARIEQITKHLNKVPFIVNTKSQLNASRPAFNWRSGSNFGGKLKQR